MRRVDAHVGGDGDAEFERFCFEEAEGVGEEAFEGFGDDELGGGERSG